MIKKFSNKLPEVASPQNSRKKIDSAPPKQEGQKWIRIHKSDVGMLRNIFREIDTEGRNKVSLNQLMVAMEKRGPATDSLKIRFRTIFETEDIEKMCGLTFPELLRLCYPHAPATQLLDIVRRVAPSLGDVDTDKDAKVRSDMSRLGIPVQIAGETRQQRRLRLAVERSTIDKSDLDFEDTEFSSFLTIGSEFGQESKSVRRPIIRVVFQKRSEQAKRLMEYCNVRRNLLTMDGLPLHTHPALQLGGGFEIGRDEFSDDEASSPISPLGSVASRRKSISSPIEKQLTYQVSSPVNSLVTAQSETKGRAVAKHADDTNSLNAKSGKGRSESSRHLLAVQSNCEVVSVYANLFRKSNMSENERAQLMSFVDKRDIEGVALLFESLSTRKLRIDSASLNHIMKAALACERPDLTVHFFATATTEDSDISQGKQSMCSDPDASCYNSLIEAHGRMGNLISAANVKNQMEMKKIWPNAETFNSWIRASIMNDNLKLAFSYLQDMQDKGFSDLISRDIRFALGFQFDPGDCADDREKQILNYSTFPQIKGKKLEVVNVGARAEHAKLERILAREIARTISEQSELEERVENLKTTLEILDSMDGEEDDSGAGFVRTRLVGMQSKLLDLEQEVHAAQMKFQQHVSQKQSSEGIHIDQVSTKSVSEEKSGSDDKNGASGHIEAVAKEKKKQQLHTTSSPLSGGLKFAGYVPPQPTILTKTIFATPKNYTTGEYTLVASLMLSSPIKSHRNDRVTIQIKNLKDLLNRDCDFLPVYGTGGRLCVNGGAKWKRTSGCITFEIADNSIVPDNYPATFRFALNVDIESNHAAVIPTIELFNSSGSLDIPPTPMDGKILEYAASVTKERLRKGKLNISANEETSNLCGDDGKSMQQTSEKVQIERTDETQNFVDWGCNLGTGVTKLQEYCFDQGFVNSWRPKTVKVFVCANVSGMASERQHLSEKIYPSLQSICQKAHVAIVWVDLRAGMLSDSSNHAWTLKVLLDEADRCHYFLCMIGNDSYGWHMPGSIPEETYTAALKGAKVLPFQMEAKSAQDTDVCDDGSNQVDNLEKRTTGSGLDSTLSQNNPSVPEQSTKSSGAIQSKTKTVGYVPPHRRRRGSNASPPRGMAKGRRGSSTQMQIITADSPKFRSPSSSQVFDGQVSDVNSTTNGGSRAVSPDRRLRTGSPMQRLRAVSPDNKGRAPSPDQRSRVAVQDNRARASSPENRQRGTSPEQKIRSNSPGRSRGRGLKNDAAKPGQIQNRFASPNGRKPFANSSSMKLKKRVPSYNVEGSEDEDACGSLDSNSVDDGQQAPVHVMLPAEADMNFFENQIHAMRHGHAWIKNHLDSGVIELEILNRLRSTKSKHRCLISIRSSPDEGAEWQDSLFITERPKKKLMHLKKKLTSSELGNLHVTEYSDPVAGAESLGRRLEILIKADWVSLAAKHLDSCSYRILQMDDHHRSFASVCIANAININSELETAVGSWLAFQAESGPFVLHGPPGCGRSSFLTKLWRHQLQNKTFNFCIIHFAEVDPSGFNALVRCCSVFDSGSSNIRSLPGKFSEICKIFVDLQAQAAQSLASRDKRILLIIDGIDDLVDEEGNNVDLCEYLPSKFSSNVKMIVSLKSDHDSLGWPVTHQWALNEMRPLDKSDKNLLVQQYLKESRKHVNSVEKWAARSGRKGYHTRSLCLLLCSLTTFSGLSNPDDIVTGSNTVNCFWHDVIRFSERIHGPIVVSMVLIPLSLARDGLSRSEVVDLLEFGKGRMPGHTDEETDAALKTISLLLVTQVLWPFEISHSLWDRGDLINLRLYIKSIIDGLYSLQGDLKYAWHELLADFFERPGVRPARMVREYPYHLMLANKKERMKKFLLNPDWNMEIVSQRLCNDIFHYWRWFGKSNMSDSYVKVLLKPQCWGCMIQSVPKAAWVQDFIERSMAQDSNELKVAEALEHEIQRKTGRKLWIQRDIVEHIRFHGEQESSTETQTAKLDKMTMSDLFQTINSKDEFGFVMNWDDVSTLQWLRVVTQILRDGLERVIMPIVSKMKESKLRLSKLEEMKRTLPHELAVIRALSRVLLVQGRELMNLDGSTTVSAQFIGPNDHEIPVESTQDLRIAGMANLPATIKIGDEIMTVTKVEGNKLTVVRSRRNQKVHECTNIVVCYLSVKIARSSSLNDWTEESRSDLQMILQRRLAVLVGVRVNQTDVVDIPIRETTDHKKLKERDVELEVRLKCVDIDSAYRIQAILEQQFSTNSNLDVGDSDLQVKINASPLHHFHKPKVFAQVVAPNRNLAVDYYWCAHLSYVADDRGDCLNKITKAIQILEEVCRSPVDHLLVQCKVYMWLLVVEKGRKRRAREKVQELNNLAQNFFRTIDQDLGHQDINSLRPSLTTKALLSAVKEADDIMMGEVQSLFEEKLQRVRRLLTPFTLLELEASSFLHPREMWMAVHVEEARDLTAMDISGSSDPFCTVSVDGNVKKTKVYRKTLDVRFCEDLHFPMVKPDPSLQIVLDVWDWDGPGRQDLIGFAQISLKGALDKEGEVVTFGLNRTQKGKGVQADGIKLGKSGYCGYLVVRFEFSFSLRQSLINSRECQSTSDLPVVHQVSTSTADGGQSRWITSVDSQTWDETIPVSTSDEHAWIKRLSFLGHMSDKDQENKRIAIDAAKLYFQTCSDLKVLPQSAVLEFIEAIISDENRSSPPLLCLRSLNSANSSTGVLACLPVLKIVPCSHFEIGKCRIDGGAARQIADAVCQQTALQSLFLQENAIGDGTQGLFALSRLVLPTASNNLTTLCISCNKLGDEEIAKLFSDMGSNRTLKSLDISHNNARSISAIALGQMLLINSTLTELDISWNQLGLDSSNQVSFVSSSTLAECKKELGQVTDSGIPGQVEGQSVATYVSKRCKESLLQNDHDGRWARHFMKGHDKFGENLLRTCTLFGLKDIAVSFISAYENYMESAQFARRDENTIKRQSCGADDMNELEPDSAGINVGLGGVKTVHLQHTPIKSKSSAKAGVMKFLSDKACVMKVRDELVRAIEEHQMGVSVRNSFSKAVGNHPLFYEDKRGTYSAEGNIILSSLEVNNTIKSLDLSWNNLGGCHSAQLCETITRVLSGRVCGLQDLNIGYNKIATPDNPPQVGNILGRMFDGGDDWPFILKLSLDGNEFGDASCRILLEKAARNPNVSMSVRGCFEHITHPCLFLPRYPYGKYSLIMDQEGRNLVRSLISLVCRKLGRFSRGVVRHTLDGYECEIVMPLTEYLRWESWEVPEHGTVSFEFEPPSLADGDNSATDQALTVLTMPEAEFAELLGQLSIETATSRRRALLTKVAQSGNFLSRQQGHDLLSQTRDHPERCHFYLCLWHLVVNENGCLNQGLFL